MIREADYQKELEEILKVIHRAFQTVADEFGITRENAPTNPAFLSRERLEEALAQQLVLYVSVQEGRIAGCIGIQPGKKEGEFYIERLAVLPEVRHRGTGKQLMAHALAVIGKSGGRTAGIGIVNENLVLKRWYENLGFTETGLKKFDHLPFTVCFMEKKLLE